MPITVAKRNRLVSPGCSPEHRIFRLRHVRHLSDTHQLWETGMISSEASLRRVYSSALGLRLTIGRDEANLSRRGNMIAAVLLGRREAHCEQLVIRGHNTLGGSEAASLSLWRSRVGGKTSEGRGRGRGRKAAGEADGGRAAIGKVFG